MTGKELNEIADLIDDTYPTTKVFISQNSLNMWSEAIGEFSKEAAFAAVRDWIKESPYAPKPADIRKLTLKHSRNTKREEITPDYFLYLKMINGHVYEHVALLATDRADLEKIKNAGYGNLPIIQRGGETHKKLIDQTKKLAGEVGCG